MIMQKYSFILLLASIWISVVSGFHGSAFRLKLNSRTSTYLTAKTSVAPPAPINPLRDVPLFNPEGFNEPVTDVEVLNSVLRIVDGEMTDTECNTLCWRCLGYKLDESIPNHFTNESVFPRWKNKYPQPPDLIGVTREYGTKFDKPIKDASVFLMRQVPENYKDCITLVPGYEKIALADLTPNIVRRLMMANWMVFFLAKLMDRTPEEVDKEYKERVAAMRKIEREEKEMIKNYMREKKHIKKGNVVRLPPSQRAERQPSKANKFKIDYDVE